MSECNPSRSAIFPYLCLAFSLLFLLLAANVLSINVAAANVSSTNIPGTYVNVGRPHGLIVDGNGDVWYIDNLNYRLVKYDPDSNSITRTVGRQGNGEGEFDTGIYDVTADADGYMYVISADIPYIYKFDPNGGYIGKYYFDVLAEPRSITYDTYTKTLLVSCKNTSRIEKFTTDMQYVNGFGSNGSGNGQFEGTWGVAADKNGRIYVADEGNNRVQVFNSSYTYQFSISSWTDEGGGSSSFNAVKDILVLSDNTITVTSQNYSVIEQFDYSGNHLRTWGYGGTGRSNMISDEFLAKDSSDNIYVSDWGKYSVSKYSATGTFISMFGNRDFEDEDGRLYSPQDVIYDASGNMYVLDQGRVFEYSNAGTYLGKVIDPGFDTSYHIAFDGSGRLYFSDSYHVRVYTKTDGVWTETATIGGSGTGSGNGEFDQPRGVFIDSSGNVYVGDLNNHRVEVFDSSFNFVRSVGAGWNGDGSPATGQLGWPHDAVTDSSGNIYVADEISVKKYSSTGTFLGIIGEGDYSSPWDMSIHNDILYVSDQHGAKVLVYDTSDGSKTDTIGSYGGGQVQFIEPIGTAINPITNTLAIVDSYGCRVEVISTGNRIVNLIPSANIVRMDSGHEGQSISDRSWDPGAEDLSNLPARMYFGDYVVADFNVDLTADRDWSGVNVISLPYDSKALVVNLNQSTAPGISSTHALYVYKYANQTSVTVCPEATTLDQVVAGCSSGYTYGDGEDGVSVITVEGKSYWRIAGLTGTGAFSTLYNTTFELKDLMTRQKVSTPSNHEITFGTTYDINHTGDVIRLVFDPEWNLSGLAISDINLIRNSDSASLTLAATAATDTWGVSITGNTIEFTAPANTGSAQGISGGTGITVTLNNQAVINPDSTGSYMINVVMLTDDGNSGQNSETGAINVPIVDSDQVDITAFVNSYVNFDIDTGTSDDDCSYNGCQRYEGADPAENYVVDLGELNSTWVNKSQDASVTHSDGGGGKINSIYLDLTSNAYGGIIVSVTSANGGLKGVGDNFIPSVEDGQSIAANSGLYGYTLHGLSSVNGTVVMNSNCTDSDTYCSLNTDPSIVFSTNGKPLDGGRVSLDIAAAANYVNNPGSYNDTLTFIATATY